MGTELSEKLIRLLEELAGQAVLMDARDPGDWDKFLGGVQGLVEAVRESGDRAFEDAAGQWLSQLKASGENRPKLIKEGLDLFRKAFKDYAAGACRPGYFILFAKKLDALTEVKETVTIISGSTINLVEELPEFISNVESALEDVEGILVSLEGRPADPEDLNTIFRAFHTLKGEAGLLGIQNIQSLAHDMESILDRVRSGKLLLTHNIADEILVVCDFLKKLIKKMRADLRGALAEPIADLKQRIASLTPEKSGLSPAAAAQERSPAPSKEERKASSVFTPKIPVLNLSEGTEIISEFISESRDHLALAEESLLALEGSPDNPDEIAKIFRSFHTIKGLASFLNLEDMRHLTHETETMMDLVRKNTLRIEPTVVSALLSAIDNTRKLLELLNRQLASGGQLNEPYHDISPALELIRGIIDRQGSGSPAAAPTASSQAKERAPIDLGSALAPELDLESSRSAATQEVYGVAKIGQVAVGLEEEETRASATSNESIKIGVSKLDALIDMTGELVITWAQLTQNPEIAESEQSKLIRDRSQLEKIVRDLQSVSMSMRLVPIKAAFQKMSRLIRDLSKKTGKDVNVAISGGETEVDKTVVELIVDPLMHMVRNSVDHGIEPRAGRLAAGKPSAGTVTLAAYHKSGNVIIEVKDDGAGLNRERILNKGWERGLLPKTETPEDSKIYSLIFEPGFSTADKITDVSGRGVGMDVVKKNIEKLRGRIEIDTQPGLGTTFIIRLPLTLAVIDGLVLRSGSERYVVPVTAVLEMMRPNLAKVTDIAGKGKMIRVRENFYPLICLATHFGVKDSNREFENMTACLIESEFGPVCLLVDEVLGQQQVVIKSLSDRFRDIKGQAGATILGDGRVGLILDINGIVRLSRGE